MRKNASQSIRGILALSVLGMVLSVCLCVSSTYAWFQDSLGSENTIKIGSFGVRVTAGLSEARSATHLSSADTIFPPGSYDLSVRGVGDTPGYALIFLEAATSDFRKDSYYTPQLNGGTGYTYRIVLHEPTAIRVTPVWGRMKGDAPLEEDKIIWYGRPPIVERTEEEQTGNVTDTPLAEGTQTALPADGVETTPTVAEKAPVSVEKTPVSMEKVPVSVEKAPVSMEKVPVSVEKAPVSMEKVPVSVEKAPVSMEKAPVSVEKAPVSIEKAPVSIRGTGTSASGETPE